MIYSMLMNTLIFFVEYRIYFGLACGFFAFFAMNFYKKKELLSRLCGFLSVICLASPASWFLLAHFTFYHKLYDLYTWTFCVLVGFVVAIFFDRKSLFFLDKIINKLTKKSGIERNKKTDVRDIETFLPSEIASYDPKKYFREDRFFIGLDEKNKPIYHDSALPHIQIVGMTGSGKGVLLGSLATQCAIADEAVFFIDPKNDEWLPHVLKSGAELANKKYYFIDLNKKDYQFNIFDDVSEDDLEELLIAGFGLDETGRESDYFKLFDRKACVYIARQYRSGETPKQLLRKHKNELLELGESKSGCKTENFISKLEELAQVESVNAENSDFKLADVVENGGVVMIIGSMKRPKIKRIQKMILVRLLQLAEARDRIASENRKIGVFLDEAKYHISPAFLEAFGAARDKGLHVVIAHQSKADFDDNDSGMKGEAVFNKIFDNSLIKLIYKVEFPETAEIFSRKSGKIQVDDETRMLEKSLSLAEKNSDKRTIRQSERYYIDENMILNLPHKCGVVFGLSSLPKFVYTSPVLVEKKHDALETFQNQNLNHAHAHDELDLGQL